MKTRYLVLLLLVAILAILLGVGYFWGTPRVLEVSPADGDLYRSSGTPLRITFSRPVRPDTEDMPLSTDPPIEGQITQEGDTLVFTPSQPWPSGGEIQVRLEPGLRAAGFPGLATRQEFTWSFSIGDPRLVYLYPADGPADLYMLDLGSGEIQQITDTPGSVLDFDVDHTGGVIYYTSSQGEGGSAIYRFDRLTGEVHPVLQCPQALCRYPRISPQGNYLAYERTDLSGNAYPQVWLIPLQGGGANQNANAPESFLADGTDQQTQYPLWSSNGSLSYYNYTQSAFIAKNPGTESEVLFPSQTGIPGDWHPDGSSYVIPEIFVEDIDQDSLADLENIPTSHLIRFDYPDGNTSNLSQENNVEDANPVFSPDGSKLAFGRKFLDVPRWTPGRQLWMMNEDGSDAHPLTDDASYNHYDFAWSPAGDQLAYVRFDKDALTQPPEIWLINADGTNATRLITGGYAPQWVP
jgi:Tol biopolymer transport system component